jgi:hypothetical protein
MPADDFSNRTKALLAERVGYACSHPSCHAATLGPSSTSKRGVSNVGVAAHITAASPTGPRYDPTLTSEQRRDAANGIWLCQTHAKAVDDDEARFPVELLHAWKVAAEHYAAEQQGRPITSRPVMRLVAYSRCVPEAALRAHHQLHEAVDAFLYDTGVPHIWGHLAGDVHALLYELALNAADHGAATDVVLDSRDASVGLSYNQATSFGVRQLRDGPGRGGQMALAALIEGYPHIRVSSQHDGQREIWTIVDLRSHDPDGIPCGLVVRSRQDWRVTRDRLTRLAMCDEVHIYVPRLFSYSDIGWLQMQLAEAGISGSITFHDVPTHPNLGPHLQRLFPEARIEHSSYPDR